MPWRTVSLLMAFVALAHFNRVSIAVAGTEAIIRPGFIDETRMGFVYSAFLLAYTAFMIPGGWLTDRAGPRAAWLVVGFGSAAGAVLTGAAGLAFSGAAGLLAALLGVRAVAGACNAPLHPAGARLVVNWVPPSGVGAANGLVIGAACVGIAAAYPVFGTLIDHFGWQHAFLITSGVTLLVAVGWAVVSADYPPRSADPPTDPSAESDPTPGLPGTGLLANRSLWLLTVSYSAVNYTEYLFFYWSGYYFEKVLGLPTDASRLNGTWLTLAMGAGMAAGGWLSDRATIRFGARWGVAVVAVTALLLSAAATTAGAFQADPTAVIGCFAVAMAAVGATEGAFWLAVVRVGGPRGGTAGGILNAGGNVGGLLAPVVTPAVAAWLGWEAGLCVAAVVCVLASVLWLGVNPGHTGRAAASG